MTRDNVSAELDTEYRKALSEALETGKKILAEGGSALDAVEKTIRVWRITLCLMPGKGLSLHMKERMNLMQQ